MLIPEPPTDGLPARPAVPEATMSLVGSVAARVRRQADRASPIQLPNDSAPVATHSGLPLAL